MRTWITIPPDDDWHLIDASAPGPSSGGSLILAACGRSFSRESRGYILQVDIERIPPRRRCPFCYASFLTGSLPA